MKAFAMLFMALLITSCAAVDDKSKEKDGIWELTLKLGDDFDDPTPEAPTTKEVITEKVPPKPMQVEKKVEMLTEKVPQPADMEKNVEVTTRKVPQLVKVEKKIELKGPYPVEVIKKVPVIVEKKVHVDRPVPYPVRVVQKEYVKVPYPVYVKRPVYIEIPGRESYDDRDYNYRQRQWWGRC